MHFKVSRLSQMKVSDMEIAIFDQIYGLEIPVCW